MDGQEKSGEKKVRDFLQQFSRWTQHKDRKRWIKSIFRLNNDDVDKWL
jgi:hypothetical protein